MIQPSATSASYVALTYREIAQIIRIQVMRAKKQMMGFNIRAFETKKLLKDYGSTTAAATPREKKAVRRQLTK